jgi:hypothetical protein
MRSRLCQECSGFVQLGALTVGLLSQDHKLGVERTGFLFLTSQFGSPCRAVQTLETIRLTALRGFKGLECRRWLLHLQQ